MTAQRNPDQLIRAFLEEGPVEMPDRAFDAARGDIHRTRQRVVLGPWREPSMSTITRLALAAVVVVAIGVGWVNFGPGLPGFGGDPTPVPTLVPTPSPAPTPVQIFGQTEPLQPGKYWFDYGSLPGWDLPGTSITITIPALGWVPFANFAVDRNYGLTDAEAGASLVIWNITNTFADPCTDHTPVVPPPGPSVDELIAALSNQAGIDAAQPVDVIVDGYAGKSVELTITTDPATCSGGLFTWGSESDGRYAQGIDEVDRVYVLDVEGERLTFFARIPARTTAEHRVELESIIDSIDIQP